MLGAKTIELIHQNVHVDAVRDDLETLVVDAELLEAVMGSPDPKKRAKEFEVKLTVRLRRHMGNPKYRQLSERLEALKERHERGMLNSVEFLKHLLEIARDLVATEKETPPAEDEDRGKAALTELFQQAKSAKTPVIVERIVTDIDEIVRLVRFPGWQQTAAGSRRARGEEGASQEPPQVSAPPGRRAIRQGVWVRKAILLTPHAATGSLHL